jgi:hypothetical protein
MEIILTGLEMNFDCVLVPLLMFVYLLYFYRDVHAVCLWDDKGPGKIHQALKEDILEFIKQAQAVSSTSLILFFGFFFFFFFFWS